MPVLWIHCLKMFWKWIVLFQLWRLEWKLRVVKLSEIQVSLISNFSSPALHWLVFHCHNEMEELGALETKKACLALKPISTSGCPFSLALVKVSWLHHRTADIIAQSTIERNRDRNYTERKPESVGAFITDIVIIIIIIIIINIIIEYYHLSQAGFQMAILLPQSLKCWD